MAPTYDLILMLDTAAPDDQRAKIRADVESALSKGGTIVSQHDWGVRSTAYEIRHKTDAEYHLLQFTTEDTALPERLNRQLRITDGVVRHRIIKLAPGTPEPPAMSAAPPAPAAAAERPPAASERPQEPAEPAEA